MQYDIFSSQPPKEPRIGQGTEVLKFITSPATPIMRQPLKPMIFAPLGAHILGVEMRYSDGAWYEVGPGQMGHVIADSGVGKRDQDYMVKAVCRDFQEHDKPEYTRLAKFNADFNGTPSNKRKGERPSDLYFLNPPEDTTKPAFALNCEALERNGGLTQFMNLSECEQAYRIAGGKMQMSVLLRNAYDVTNGCGQLRATSSGISSNPVIRLNLTMSSTPKVARDFYQRDIHNGLFSRVTIAYVPVGKREGKIPKKKEWDEEYLATLDHYPLRLKSAHGRYNVPELNRVADRLAVEMADLANLADSDELFGISHRSIFSAWKKAAMLWLLNDMTYTRSIGEWMVYFCYYDLWSRMQVFGQMITPSDEPAEERQKRGPVNMLQDLPNPFSEEQLENLRTSHGKAKEGTKRQIAVWVSRGFVEYSNQTGLYLKTEKYLKSSKFKVQSSKRYG